MPASTEERLAALEESKRLTEMQDLASRMTAVEVSTAKILENVSNHIPTQIRDLASSINKLTWWIIGLLASATIAALGALIKGFLH